MPKTTLVKRLVLFFILFIIGYLTLGQLTETNNFFSSIFPRWQTNTEIGYFSLIFILSKLAIVSFIFIICHLIPMGEKYFTLERIEFLNIGLSTIGGLVILTILSEIFLNWYSGISYEQFAFITNKNGDALWGGFFNYIVGIMGTQLFWRKFFRQNIRWSIIISFLIIMGDILTTF